MRSFRAPIVRRLRRDQQGVTAVEFGIVAPVLILLIMGIVEIGLMLTAQAVLDNAAFTASRVGKTGATTTTSTQAQLILAAVKKAAGTYLNSDRITIKSTAYNDYSSIGQPEPFTDLNKNGVYDSGEPFTDVNGNGVWDKDQGASGYGSSSQIVVYTMSYDWPLFTPLMKSMIGKAGVSSLTSRIVVRNEPYG